MSSTASEVFKRKQCSLYGTLNKVAMIKVILLKDQGLSSYQHIQVLGIYVCWRFKTGTDVSELLA